PRPGSGGGATGRSAPRGTGPPPSTAGAAPRTTRRSALRRPVVPARTARTRPTPPRARRRRPGPPAECRRAGGNRVRPAPRAGRGRAPAQARAWAASVAADEGLHGVAGVVVAVLHRRRLHEVGRSGEQRARHAAVLGDLRRPDR